MAWSISMSQAGWNRLRQRLDEWCDDALIRALADDRYESVYQVGGEKHATAALGAAIERLRQLSHDELVDAAMKLIAEHQTCEAGGHGVWVDREGFHIVWLDDDTRDS